jgi:site-specific DNA-methyltransferase (adenine-specific)
MKIKNGEFRLGDCIELLKEVPDNSVDMVFTDPPYKMTKTSNSCRPNYMPDGYVIGNQLPDVSLWMKEVFRVMAPNTHFYTFTNRNDLRKYLNVAEDVGFGFHNIINMIKDTKMPNRWYLKYTEPLLFFRKGKAKPINDMTSRDYEMVNMVKGEDKLHPTQKPLTFVEKIIKNSSNEGDVVLDPFSGSGTTALACENTNRKWLCIEKDAAHYRTSCDRLLYNSTLDNF